MQIFKTITNILDIKGVEACDLAFEKSLSYLSKEDFNNVLRARDYAKKEHSGQVRATKEPYFIHLIKVASLVSSIKLDANSIIASLLHDIIEDQSKGNELERKEELKQMFNEEVSFLVDGLTKIKEESRKKSSIATFHKILDHGTRDVKIFFIKLSDVMHNMYTLENMARDKIVEKSKECQNFYVPLAKQLGLYLVYQFLENQAFRHLYPNEYEKIDKKLNYYHVHLMPKIETLGKELVEIFKQKGISITIRIESRPHFKIHEKNPNKEISKKNMLKKNKYVDRYLGIVIISKTEDECYAGFGIMSEHWGYISKSFKNFISYQKHTGYRGLYSYFHNPLNPDTHLAISFQTEEMFKESRVSGLGKWSNEALDSIKTVEDNEQYVNHIYKIISKDPLKVWSKLKGETTLPYGSCVLDLAYHLGFRLGNHCDGAIIKKQKVPVSHLLKDGDIVSFSINENIQNQKPYLDLVKTPKAKKAIENIIS